MKAGFNRVAVLLLVATMLLTAMPVSAANPQLIFGSWIEKFPNGSGMVTQFTPTGVASQPVNAFNKPTGPVNQLSASYNDMGQAAIGVNLQGGNALVITVQNPQLILLDFGNGSGIHRLVRMP